MLLCLHRLSEEGNTLHFGYVCWYDKVKSGFISWHLILWGLFSIGSATGSAPLQLQLQLEEQRNSGYSQGNLLSLWELFRPLLIMESSPTEWPCFHEGILADHGEMTY